MIVFLLNIVTYANDIPKKPFCTIHMCFFTIVTTCKISPKKKKTFFGFQHCSHITIQKVICHHIEQLKKSLNYYEPGLRWYRSYHINQFGIGSRVQLFFLDKCHTLTTEI